MKNISFLTGAGASLSAGYSSTDDLTKLILTSKDYQRNAGRWVAIKCITNPCYLSPVLHRIIQWLFCQTEKYFCWRNEAKKISYEDIYYLASQMSDEYTELQNPALLPLINQLMCELASWTEYRDYCETNGHEWKRPDRTEFHVLCEHTCDYIRDIVAEKLSVHGKCFKHLELITSVNQAPNLDLQGITTLAHDTHLETYFHGKDVKLADGFGPILTDSDWRVWENRFRENDFIPYLKLHGSVNWGQLRKEIMDDVRPSTIGIRSNTSHQRESRHCRTNNSICWNTIDEGRPLLLIGTFNKPIRYTRDIMLDIHYQFRRVLQNTDTLVVCGYSFGDKAINTHLVFWWNSQKRRSLVVIDPVGRCKVIETARYSAKNFLCSPRTSFINKKMHEVDVDQLMARLDLHSA